MDQLVDNAMSSPRALSSLLLVLSALALLITITGISGVIAYSVTLRRKEVGIRMALGAKGRDVMRLMLMEAMQIIGFGIVGGIVGAALMRNVLARYLFGVSALDPLVIFSVAAVLAAGMLAVSAVPARQAASISPNVAIRTK